MGVLKNDVGRPTNKIIMVRRVLKGICLIVVIALVVIAGYYLKGNEYGKKIATSKKENKVSTEKAKRILKKYSINDSIYFLTTQQFNQNYKVLLAIKNTKSSVENNICEKINKYYNSTSSKDQWNNYLIKYINGYGAVYCNDENKFYSYTDLEKQYKKLFGKNTKLPTIKTVDNSGEFEIYTYLNNPRGYVQLGNEQGGSVEDGETEYIYDAYISSNEIHIIFSSFFYIDTDFDGKLRVYFSEEIDENDIDNNLSETADGKISGNVEQFFVKNRNKIPVYEIIFTKEDGNYIYKSINRVK